MDASAVLRQQSRKKIHGDFLRMKNEHNTIPADPKPSKLVSAPHFSSQDSENRDPGRPEMSRKTPVRAGISRLPVLAKSLQLQTPYDFSQSHCRWEEKPLAGKSKKKKPCTRPVPFNLSHPKNTTARKNQQPVSLPQSRTGTYASHLTHDASNVHLKKQNINSKPSKHPAVLNCHVEPTQQSNGKATDNISQLLGQNRPLNTSKTSATLSNPLPAVALSNTQHQISTSSAAQPALIVDNCLETMNLLSLKDPTKTKQASQDTELNTQVEISEASTDKGENFQPDHAAFLSILRNEGINATSLGSATPHSKPYNYVPQRVSVMKSRQKAGATTGLSKLVQFSPDAAALQSILQNVGVSAGGPFADTPGKSVCPSGRGTSVYTAQRVPIRKTHAEATGGPMAVTLKETPQKIWTPQRVRNTRHLPMSAMKWQLLTQQTPYINTPGLRSCKTDLQLQQEKEVVQKLFDDQEEDLDKRATENPDTQTDQLTIQASSTKPHCEERVERSRTNTSEEEEEEEEQKRVGGQPFLQAPERESVIFFSTGKKLFRAPHCEKQKSSYDQQQIPCVSELTCLINPSLQSLHRDIVQKSCGLSPAVALLRKRLPPLEELRMDEEVATYTSLSVPAAPGFVLPRPRCGNPLASVLHFEESSRFVPISFDISSGPSSPLSSPQQER